MTLALPPGYEHRPVRGADGFAWSTAAPWVASVLEQAITLHEWAATADGAERMSGRGTVYSVPAAAVGPDRRERWAVRHYMRGGHFAAFLGDRYLRRSRTRPTEELWASVEARSRGIETPAVVAGAVYRAGAFYRADLVTELVPAAVDLADAVFGPGAIEEGKKALAATSRLIRRLEGARVLHADLNAKNVLLVSDGDERTAHVLDLDRCTVLSPDARSSGEVMRRRLERSLTKLGRQHGRPLTQEQWGALASASETGS